MSEARASEGRRFFPRVRRRTWRRARRWLFVGAAGLVAFLVILSFALTSVPGGGNRTANAERSQRSPRNPTVGQTLAYSEQAVHICQQGQRINYPSFPPAIGNHWGIWARCGFYEGTMNDEHVVHNMEHGHVVISYNLPDPVQFDDMKSLAGDLRQLDSYGVVRSYPRIPEGTVAMTAWGVGPELVDGVNEERIRAFYDEHRANTYSEETDRRGSSISC